MKKIRLIMITLLTGLMASCAVYVPSMPDIARLEQKGDLELGASATIQTGIEFSAAYSPVDHLGIQLYMGGLGIDDWPMLFRGAVGYYLPFDNRTTLAFYGGLSQGYSYYDGYSSIEDYVFQSWFNTAFIEADYGWRVCDWLEMSARLAGGAMWYTADHDRYYHNPESYDHEVLQQTVPILEPTLQLRFGTEHLKINVKAGWTWMPASTQFYFPLQFGVGLSLHLPTGTRLK